MIKRLAGAFSPLKHVFTQTRYGWPQLVLIALAAAAFIAMPQFPPTDWDLYTRGFWSNFPHTYLDNRNLVSPPWGLILLVPYYLAHPAGARVASVLTAGWLAHRRQWPLTRLMILVLSPYFMLTMAKSNMDILVSVLPLLIWEYSGEGRWSFLSRGLSLALMLLKPQCTILLLLYLVCTTPTKRRQAWGQFAVLALLLVPISFVGSPPLIFQWLTNILHPSSQNQYFWAINNISLTATIGLWLGLSAAAVLLAAGFGLVRAGILSWKRDQTIASMLLLAMFLLPYASEQSFSAALTFIPSWPALVVQWVGVAAGLLRFGNPNMAIWAFSVAVFSLLCDSLLGHRLLRLTRTESADKPTPSGMVDSE